MNASWVKDSTATTGTGTMTLAGTPDSGFLGFDDVFSTGDVVHYTVEDGNNRETGIGTLTSGASWTLSRDQIFEKLDTGSYSHWPATGITLSGSATVGIASSANNVINSTTHYVQSGHYGIPHNFIEANVSSTAMVANRAWAAPAVFHAPVKITNLNIDVGTADAGETIGKAGIYSCKETGLPGKLLGSVTIDATTSGNKEVALASPIYLTPGLYFFVYATDGTPSIYQANTTELVSYQTGALSQGGSAGQRYIYKTLSSWSDLPDPFGAITAFSYTLRLPVVGFT